MKRSELKQLIREEYNRISLVEVGGFGTAIEEAAIKLKKATQLADDKHKKTLTQALKLVMQVYNDKS